MVRDALAIDKRSDPGGDDDDDDADDEDDDDGEDDNAMDSSCTSLDQLVSLKVMSKD
jgi:hypothetical protein